MLREISFFEIKCNRILHLFAARHFSLFFAWIQPYTHAYSVLSPRLKDIFLIKFIVHLSKHISSVLIFSGSNHSAIEKCHWVFQSEMKSKADRISVLHLRKFRTLPRKRLSQIMAIYKWWLTFADLYGILIFQM